ncbi:MAG: hypothetical protein EAY75_14645 [Bacteroidetes bacterium]|nr:MAG: hypothetical protein EAY75_14645 [Bacteroidota bacterium]
MYKLLYFSVLLFSANCLAQTFTYDNLSRLTAIDYPNGNKITYAYDKLGNRISQTLISEYCPPNTPAFIATLPGTKFQWQVKIDSVSSFAPISDNNIYYGSKIDSLVIMNPATTMVGYRYRCAVTLDGETSFGPEYELRIKAIWQGGADSVWLNPANWECGLVPAPKIDVIIPKQANAPIISNDTKVESILLKEGETLTILPGVKLEITGKPKN